MLRAEKFRNEIKTKLERTLQHTMYHFFLRCTDAFGAKLVHSFITIFGLDMFGFKQKHLGMASSSVWVRVTRFRDEN